MYKKLLRLNWDDFIAIAGVLGGIFLLEQIIVTGVMLIAKPDSTFLFAPIILPIVYSGLILLFTAVHIFYTVELGIRFSVTRRRAVPAVLAMAATQAVFAMVLAAVLSKLDQLITYGIWARQIPGLEVHDTYGIFPWWGLLLAGVVCLALGVIFGAGVQRFGMKVLWGLWALCMMPALLMGVMDRIEDFIPVESLWLLPIALVALFIWAISSLLKATVKG